MEQKRKISNTPNPAQLVLQQDSSTLPSSTLQSATSSSLPWSYMTDCLVRDGGESWRCGTRGEGGCCDGGWRSGFKNRDGRRCVDRVVIVVGIGIVSPVPTLIAATSGVCLPLPPWPSLWPSSIAGRLLLLHQPLLLFQFLV